VVVACAAGLIWHGPYDRQDWITLAVLALLFFICESLPALLSFAHARVSLSFSAALASVVLLGPAGAALVGLGAIASVRRDVGPVNRIYNAAQFAVCGYAAGLVFAATGGDPGVPTTASFPGIIGPFAAAVGTYLAANLGLIGGILWCARQGTPDQLRWRPMAHLLMTYLGYGMFGLLIATLWRPIGAFSAVLVLLPLLVARWAFQQTRAERQAYEATIAALCQAVETKDFYTRGHSERVSKASTLIAREIGMRPERVEAIRYAGMLHDVGKLGVPTNVLRKSGALSEAELAAIQLHPMRGLEIVREIGFLDEAHAGIMHHHERVDGGGYPMGLAGMEIPEFARVIAVADAFDSMTSNRSYRPARSLHEGIQELRDGAGTQFDPAMVAAFIRVLEREHWQVPAPLPPPITELETTEHDHDDPSTPLRVGEGGR
jgi:HD domain